MIRIWKRFLAMTRLSKAAVCEMSQGAADYHDYPDSTTPEPLHFHIHTLRAMRKALRHMTKTAPDPHIQPVIGEAK